MTTPHDKDATLDDLDAEVVEDLDVAGDVAGGATETTVFTAMPTILCTVHCGPLTIGPRT